MPADGIRNPRTPKEFRFTLRVVEQTVVRRVEPSGYGKRILYVYRDPVAKHHSGFVRVMSKLDVPAREIPEEESTTGLEYPHTFGDPSLAPPEALFVFQRIIDPSTVVFTKVEWWICEDQIHALFAYLRQDLETIRVVQLA